MDEKIMVALSGGVDSSLAACLMVENGFDCIGAAMRLTGGTDIVSEAEAIARYLHIPFYSFDFTECFRSKVMDGFARDYTEGKTPNPCISCNRWLKFGALLKEADDLGCDYLATGHYARIGRDPDSGRYLLKKAFDAEKDQSYFLYGLTQMQLSRICFPLGDMKKSDVRKCAHEKSLPSADRPESQDICFVSDGNYAEFVENFCNCRFPEGDFVDASGNVLGRHRGIIHYTVGQRKGLGIAFGEPRYVLRVDPHDNTVTLGSDEDLFSRTLTAVDINLISCDRITAPVRVKARIRSRHSEQWATVEQLDENSIKVDFEQPQRAITPGQAVVLYDGDVVIGGGTII